MKKITFFGDIMCEPSVLKAAKKGKDYDFGFVFEGVRSLLKNTDCRIGNLETPMAGDPKRIRNRKLIRA